MIWLSASSRSWYSVFFFHGSYGSRIELIVQPLIFTAIGSAQVRRFTVKCLDPRNTSLRRGSMVKCMDPRSCVWIHGQVPLLGVDPRSLGAIHDH